MADRITFVERCEVEPLRGPNLQFVSHSGGGKYRTTMERSAALKVAYDILRVVTDSDLADLDDTISAEVIPFPEPLSQYRRAG